MRATDRAPKSVNREPLGAYRMTPLRWLAQAQSVIKSCDQFDTIVCLREKQDPRAVQVRSI